MIHITKHKNLKLPLSLIVLGILVALSLAVPAYAVNVVDCPDGTSVPMPPGSTYDQVCAGHMQKQSNNQPANPSHGCGSDGNGGVAVSTSINFGCKGESCLTSHPDVNYCSGENSAILDVTFAIIRFLSYGVGLVIIGSLVVAGIQYTSSQGDPKASAEAQQRIKSTVIALLIFIFGYAILNYILPAGFLK